MVTEHSFYPRLPLSPSFVLIPSFVPSGGAPGPDRFLHLLLTSEPEGFSLFSCLPELHFGASKFPEKMPLSSAPRGTWELHEASGSQWGH